MRRLRDHPVRRHPIVLVLAIVSGGALAWVAGTGEWGDLALYGSMTGLIAVLGVIVVLSEIRQRGPEIFAERKRSSSARGS